jgi:hypothetical protein
VRYLTVTKAVRDACYDPVWLHRCTSSYFSLLLSHQKQLIKNINFLRSNESDLEYC